MIASAAEAGKATADALSLSGGMNLIDGTFITAMFTGIAAIIGAIGTLLWKNHQAAKAQRPLDSSDLYVRCAECAEHRKAINQRIDELGPALNRIFKKLNENDTRSEQRAMDMHRRLDPFVEKLADTAGKVELIQKLAGSATIGGHK